MVFCSDILKKGKSFNCIFSAISIYFLNLWFSEGMRTSTKNRERKEILQEVDFEQVNVRWVSTHLTFTCSKSTKETLEKGMKYVLVLLLLTLNIFHNFFQCFYC